MRGNASAPHHDDTLEAMIARARTGDTLAARDALEIVAATFHPCFPLADLQRLLENEAVRAYLASALARIVAGERRAGVVFGLDRPGGGAPTRYSESALRRAGDVMAQILAHDRCAGLRTSLPRAAELAVDAVAKREAVRRRRLSAARLQGDTGASTLTPTALLNWYRAHATTPKAARKSARPKAMRKIQ